MFVFIFYPVNTGGSGLRLPEMTSCPNLSGTANTAVRDGLTAALGLRTSRLDQRGGPSAHVGIGSSDLRTSDHRTTGHRVGLGPSDRRTAGHQIGLGSGSGSRSRVSAHEDHRSLWKVKRETVRTRLWWRILRLNWSLLHQHVFNYL